MPKPEIEQDDFDKLAASIQNDKPEKAAKYAVIIARRFVTALERIATALEKKNG